MTEKGWPRWIRKGNNIELAWKDSICNKYIHIPDHLCQTCPSQPSCEPGLMSTLDPPIFLACMLTLMTLILSAKDFWSLRVVVLPWLDALGRAANCGEAEAPFCLPSFFRCMVRCTMMPVKFTGRWEARLRCLLEKLARSSRVKSLFHRRVSQAIAGLQDSKWGR